MSKRKSDNMNNMNNKISSKNKKINGINELSQFFRFSFRGKGKGFLVHQKSSHLELTNGGQMGEASHTPGPEGEREERPTALPAEAAHLLQKAAIGSTLVTSTSSSSAASAPAGDKRHRCEKEKSSFLLAA